MIVIAFLLPLLPLPALFLLEAAQASNELAADERVQPQSAAQLSALPDGRKVLIEGRLDAQNTKNLAFQQRNAAAPAEIAALFALSRYCLGLACG